MHVYKYCLTHMFSTSSALHIHNETYKKSFWRYNDATKITSPCSNNHLLYTNFYSPTRNFRDFFPNRREYFSPRNNLCYIVFIVIWSQTLVATKKFNGSKSSRANENWSIV